MIPSISSFTKDVLKVDLMFIFQDYQVGSMGLEKMDHLTLFSKSVIENNHPLQANILNSLHMRTISKVWANIMFP